MFLFTRAGGDVACRLVQSTRGRAVRHRVENGRGPLAEGLTGTFDLQALRAQRKAVYFLSAPFVNSFSIGYTLIVLQRGVHWIACGGAFEDVEA